MHRTWNKWIGIALLMTGCGYQVQSQSGDIAMVRVPLITEDEGGVLRTALAETMMASRKFRYTDATTAPYELIVKIEKNYTDTVAYMHERKEGTLKRTIPSEGKKTMVARVELRDRTTKKPYLKPFTVTVQGQYDFVNPTSVNDAEFQKTSLLEYSLGQLDAEEVAKVDMQGPMFQELAKKIAEGLARAPKE